MPQHASDKDENVELTLRTWFENHKPSGLKIYYGPRNFDDKDRPDVHSVWASFEMVHFAGWQPNDPTIFQVDAYGRAADDTHGRAAMTLRDAIKALYDVEGGIPLLDFAGNPTDPTPPEVGNNFMLFVRHAETAKVPAMGYDDTEAFHRFSITFHVYHWRDKQTGY
jgi:hypothetical protein